jgi:hypothetical protein
MFVLVVQMNINIPKLIMLDFEERGSILPTFTTELIVNNVQCYVFVHKAFPVTGRGGL